MVGRNAFEILGYVSKELRKRKMDEQAYQALAMSGTYGELCKVSKQYAEECDKYDQHVKEHNEAHVEGKADDNLTEWYNF
jgi:hypothetical protein